MTEPISVGILEDFPILRDSLALALGQRGLKVTVSTGDPDLFLAEVGRTLPKVVLIDLVLKRADGREVRDGFEVLKELRIRHPAIRSLVISAKSNAELVSACYHQGAAGYLFKLTATADTLAASIRAVCRGERVFPAQALEAPLGLGSDSVRRERDRLTPREREVLSYVGSGVENPDIAELLGISERTVKAHIAALYQKLGAANRVLLAIKARELGILPPERISAQAKATA